MPFAVDTNATLTIGLAGYWALEEASGTRVDATGRNNLTDNNTVTQAAGKVGNAASFTKANNEWLSCTPTVALRVSSNFSISAWLYLASKSTTMMALSHSNNAAGGESWIIFYDQAADRLKFIVYDSGGGNDQVTANNLGSPATATWYHVVAVRDGSTIKITVNNGSADSVASTRTPNNTGSPFTIGDRNVGANLPWDGRIDEFGFWQTALSTQNKTDLYNSGNGNAYSAAAAGAVRLVNGGLVG